MWKPLRVSKLGPVFHGLSLLSANSRDSSPEKGSRCTFSNPTQLLWLVMACWREMWSRYECNIAGNLTPRSASIANNCSGLYGGNKGCVRSPGSAYFAFRSSSCFWRDSILICSWLSRRQSLKWSKNWNSHSFERWALQILSNMLLYWKSHASIRNQWIFPSADSSCGQLISAAYMSYSSQKAQAHVLELQTSYRTIHCREALSIHRLYHITSAISLHCLQGVANQPLLRANFQ